MADEEAQSQLVVVGASAGGIDALSTLVATLPREFPAPVVVAQHLDPRRPSHLAAILSTRSTLPIRLVADQATLTPGTVFIVPSNHHVEISDQEVTVTEAGDVAPRPSVNRLFESAAESFGEGLIAVILSGTGSDGAIGARHVKAMGGTVVIQNPETASFPEMPQSLSPTIVDIVADLDSIGPLLNDLVTGVYEASRPDDDRLLRAFLSDLRERTGIDFASYKRPTIMRRLQRRMVATGTPRMRDYVRFVHAHPEEFQRLTSSFLIKVTEFFRDGDLFEYLRNEVIPALIEAARSHDFELRVWSAGCATGEEAYSIAILLCEALGDSVGRFNVRIFATDIDADAVAFARRGIYSPAAVATMPAALIEKYFTGVDGDFEIKKQVRALTVFGQHDLGQRAPFPRIDLALCRNVLIYFTPELQKRALQLFAFSLREAGYLVLGKAESTSPLPEHFVLEQPRLKIYRRHGERVLIPPARIRDTAPLVTPKEFARPTGWREGQTRTRRDSDRAPTPAERAETILLHLPIGVATVNEVYDIQWINGAARRLLGIHTAAIGSDFVHLVGGLPSQNLRQLIDSAFAGTSMSSTFEFRSAESGAEGPRYVRIACQPHLSDSANPDPELVSIVVTDVTSYMTDSNQRQNALDDERARAGQLSEEVEQLGQSNKYLLRTNDELTSENAELRSGNEELLVANEEVQAASEEVETLNEELQATNEELETLNEELQATVEELNTANDDLESRAVELQNLAASLGEQRTESEAARALLEAVLQTMPIPVLVVDAIGQRVLANEWYERAFPAGVLLEEVNGRPLLGPNSIESRALRDSEGMELDFSARSPDGERNWYSARALPVATGGAIAGSVVTFRPCPKPEPCSDEPDEPADLPGPEKRGTRRTPADGSGR